MSARELNPAILAAAVSRLRLSGRAASAGDGIASFRFLLDGRNELPGRPEIEAALNRRLKALDGAARPDRRRTPALADYERIAVIGATGWARFVADLLGRHHRIVGPFDPRGRRSAGSVGGIQAHPLAPVEGQGCDAVLVVSPDEPALAALLASWRACPPVFHLRDVFDRLVVFGAGAGGQQVLDTLPDPEMVLCFADNDAAKQGTVVRGVPVVGPAALAGLDFDYVVIGSIHRESIVQQLLASGVPDRKLLPVDPQRAVPAAFARRTLPMARVRRFTDRLTRADVARAASFGAHCRSAVLLSFEAQTVAVGAALAASGCRVTAFGAPWFLDGVRSGGVTARTAPAGPADVSPLDGRTAIVAGEAGVPASLHDALRPTHKLIVPVGAAPAGAHLRTDHLTFWYAPPRGWLTAASHFDLEPRP